MSRTIDRNAFSSAPRIRLAPATELALFAAAMLAAPAAHALGGPVVNEVAKLLASSGADLATHLTNWGPV